MKNLKAMNANNLFIFYLLLLITFSVFSQESHFLLNDKNQEYSYSINKNKSMISISSNHINSNFTITFKVEKIDFKKCCERVKYKTFKWLLNNERYKYQKGSENFIELNNFIGLVLIKKSQKKCYAYKVKSRIFEEE